MEPPTTEDILARYIEALVREHLKKTHLAIQEAIDRVFAETPQEVATPKKSTCSAPRKNMETFTGNQKK